MIFLRVGIFTDTYIPEINGVATSVQQLKRGLEASGNEVYVFAPKNRIKNFAEKNVIRERSVSCPLIKDRRICCFNMSRALKKVGTLKLDIIHCQTEFEMGQLAIMSAKKYNIPIIHTYHTVYEDYTHYLKFPGCNSRVTKSAVRKLSKVICNKVDKVIVPTEKIKHLLEGYGVTKEIVIQATGINCQKFKNIDLDKVNSLRNKFNINSENRVLITVGRIAKEKSIIDLIRFLPLIVDKQKDIKLIIVGNGPEMTNLERECKRLNLENNIIFTGSVPWADIENYYALGDIFVGASTTETQGITYMEALAAGKPLLVRWDECLENVLVNNKNGIGFFGADDFVKGYFDICNNYDEMVKGAYKKAEEYSDIIFAKNIEEVYKSCIKMYE